MKAVGALDWQAQETPVLSKVTLAVGWKMDGRE